MNNLLISLSFLVVAACSSTTLVKNAPSEQNSDIAQASPSIDGGAVAAEIAPAASADKNSLARELLSRLDGKVMFENGQTQVDASALSTIQDLAQALAATDLKLNLIGHADATGTPGANQAISERRADAVRQALLANGAREEQLVARGVGASQPIDSNSTITGRNQNRRVELRVAE